MSDKAPRTQVIDERTLWRSVWFPGPYIAGMLLGSFITAHGAHSLATGEKFQIFDSGIFDGKFDNAGEVFSAFEWALLPAVLAGIVYLGLKPQKDTVDQRVLVEQPPAPQPPQVQRRQS